MIGMGADVGWFPFSVQEISDLSEKMQAQTAALEAKVEMTAVGIAVKWCDRAMLKVLRYAGANLGLGMKRSYGAVRAWRKRATRFMMMAS